MDGGLISLTTAGQENKKIGALFYDWGPPIELPTDIYKAFCSQMVKEVLVEWGGQLWFWCAYISMVNGIIETFHQNIKRKQWPITESCYWYIILKDNISPSTMPAMYNPLLTSQSKRIVSMLLLKLKKEHILYKMQDCVGDKSAMYFEISVRVCHWYQQPTQFWLMECCTTWKIVASLWVL